MRYVGTFFGVIAMALAATVSIDNHQAQLAVAESTITNSTDATPNDQLPGNKVFWDWISGAWQNIQSSFGSGFNQNPTTSTEPEPLASPEDCANCKCGVANKGNRIVGGVETQENQYPWVVQLLNEGRFYCGGSVINSRYILTAAHCVEGFDKSKITVRLLEHDRNSSFNEHVQNFEVKQIIRHGGYSIFNYNNDIALIKLKQYIKFEGLLRPVCLPELTKTFAGEKGIVTGWGAIGESGPISNTLREVTVPILSNVECKDSKYPARRITDNMLCAGYTEGGKDSCQGDSGGPLHVMENSTYHIAGIVSWGEGCAAPNYPGVYTRVNRFSTWIQRNTQDACYC